MSNTPLTPSNDALCSDPDAGLFSSFDGIMIFAKLMKMAADDAVLGKPDGLLRLTAMIASDPSFWGCAQLYLMKIDGPPN